MKWERVDIQALDRQWTSNAYKEIDKYKYLTEVLEAFKRFIQRAPKAHDELMGLVSDAHRDLKIARGRLMLVNVWKPTANNPARLTIGLDELAQIYTDPEWDSDQAFLDLHRSVCEKYNVEFGLQADPMWSMVTDTYWADVRANKRLGSLACYVDMPAGLEQTLIAQGEIQ